MNPTITLPTISLFLPEFRRMNNVHPTSIINTIYQAFDHFNIEFRLNEVPVSTLLEMPLKYLFTTIPENHWLKRNSKALAKDALYYCNTTLKALRFIRAPTGTRSQRRLSKRIVEDIYISTILQFKQDIQHILDSPEVIDSNIDTSLHTQFITNDLWRKFNSKVFRLHQYDSANNRQLAISRSKSHKFWSTKMLLPARQVWYRTLCNKIPHGRVALKMKIVETAQCRICHNADEDLDHFLLQCQFKTEIWQHIINHYYPNTVFDKPSLLEFIKTLQLPEYIPHQEFSNFITIVSTVLYLTWKHHWNYIIDNVPIVTPNIITTILRQIDILLC